ncbi:hypothetical protein WG66_003384 [Moniliophthora roreri]|nr:hypothetical protein WG66_003384 [Moniliophthora roreri]
MLFSNLLAAATAVGLSVLPASGRSLNRSVVIEQASNANNASLSGLSGMLPDIGMSTPTGSTSSGAKGALSPTNSLLSNLGTLIICKVLRWFLTTQSVFQSSFSPLNQELVHVGTGNGSIDGLGKRSSLLKPISTDNPNCDGIRLCMRTERQSGCTPPLDIRMRKRYKQRAATTPTPASLLLSLLRLLIASIDHEEWFSRYKKSLRALRLSKVECSVVDMGKEDIRTLETLEKMIQLKTVNITMMIMNIAKSPIAAA